MARVISLFLPIWSTDWLRRKLGVSALPLDVPLALIGRYRRRQVVVAADENAQKLGILLGMPATQARLIEPDLIVHEHDAAGDLEALEQLALWMFQLYAPIVAVDGTNGLIIDSTGADHLHGGETALLESMIARLQASGVMARAAIADSWGAAHALARHRACPIHIAPPGMIREHVEALPVQALRLTSNQVESLQGLGFNRISDLLARPRAPLALRFGPEIMRRLDQMLGLAAEPIDPVRPVDLIEVQRNFAEPIAAAETISRYISKLVVQLCADLEAKGLGARRLDLVCHRVDAQVQAIRCGTSLPVRDVKRLTRLLSDKIETISPGFGIETMSLTASIVEPLHNKQTMSTLVDEAVPDLSDLIDTLMNHPGVKRIYRIEPVASDVPERCFRRVPPLAPISGATWPNDWPRPTRLLPRPERIETMALLPDHPPVSFTWRGVRHRVQCADGPERIFGEWWKRDVEVNAVRDYFRVENERGERFWIFRAGDGEDRETGSHEWFMHGIFG